MALPCYGNSKLRLAHCASDVTSVCLVLSACVLERADFSLSPSSQAGNIKGRMFMMDGQLFKERHHRVLDGRDPNQDSCDVTRQTGTSFTLCRDVRRRES